MAQDSSNKKELGQFYTTNQEYILQGFKIPVNIRHIIEPFAGNGDLINFVKKMDPDNRFELECCDIEPKHPYITKLDTLQNPPNYTNKFLITNPPYLARNKSKTKALFDKYDVNDLYKCLIKELLTNQCLGGILIIPLNFWSSIRKADIDLRKSFLSHYSIVLLNIFEERVFDDTSYTICSFQFELIRGAVEQPRTLDIMVYPSNINIKTQLNENNNYIIGGEIYHLTLSDAYKITRLTKKNKAKANTNILVKCIDDNEQNKIGLTFVADKDIYVDITPNQSARTFASLVIEPAISQEKQKQLIEKFNNFLEAYRKKYNSLFLTNYRESKDIARKRISFDLVYSIIEYILENFESHGDFRQI